MHVGIVRVIGSGNSDPICVSHACGDCPAAPQSARSLELCFPCMWGLSDPRECPYPHGIVFPANAGIGRFLFQCFDVDTGVSRNAGISQ